MTKEQKKELIVGGGLVAIAALLVWLAHHGSRTAAAAPMEMPPVPASSEPPIPPLSLPAIGTPPIRTSPVTQSSGGGCGCGGDCPSDPNQIPTLNKIISIGNAASQAIYSQGDATLRAIAAIGSNSNLNVVVEPSNQVDYVNVS